MDFIKKHKSSFIVVGICLILLVLIGLVVKFMFISSGDKYGNRLKDAPTIENKNIETMTKTIKENDFVVDMKYELNAVTMRFFIDVKENTKLENAKKLSEIVIKNLDSKIINFYDIELYLTQKNGEDVEYPAIGYHSKTSKEFNWTNNKGETNEK